MAQQVRRPAINRAANSAPQVASTAPAAPGEPAPAQTAPAPAVPTIFVKPKSNFEAIRDLLGQKIGSIKKVIPPGVPLTADGLIQNALQQIMSSRESAKLKQCSPNSVLFAVLACASIGLDLIGDQGHLVPMGKFNKDGRGERAFAGYQCSFWPDYKGIITVARRSGYSIDPHEVRTNDTFECHLGTRNEIIHSVGFGDRGEIEGFYAIVRDQANNVVRIERMDKTEVDAIKQDTEVWRQHYDRMGLKTVLKRAFKLLPKNSRAELILSQVEQINDAEGDLSNLSNGLLNENEPAGIQA